MNPTLGIGLSMEQRLETLPSCTIKLACALQHPVAYAESLYGPSRKVNVPIEVGMNTIIVRAALVKGEELGKLFDGEAFGGAIGGNGGPLLFLRKDIEAPAEFAPLMPRLIAFHCLSSLEVPRWGDESGTLAQFQAISLELAYARRLMAPEAYGRYEEWRASVERTDFFKREDWKEIVDRTHEAFSDHSEGIHRNAHALKMAVVTKGETFTLRGDKAFGPRGEEIPIHRKTRRT